MTLAELFEAIMVVCFGCSWPLSVYKSVKSRTAKGKSLFFEVLIWIGYIFGICGKIMTHNISYVLVFYFINITMVSIDIGFYFRNARLDRMAELESKE